MPQRPASSPASAPAPVDGSPGSPPTAAHEPTEALAVRLAQLETTVADLKGSDRGWLKTAALLFAVLGAVVSIPKALIDFAGTIHRQPKTTVIADNPLSVSYEPVRNNLRFESVVILKNDGNAADAIKRASGSLLGTEKNSGDYVNSDDIQFTEGTSVVETPVVQPGSPVGLTILLSVNLPPQNAIQLLSGSHRLEVTLTSLAKPKKISFCFNFDPNQANDIVNAKPKRLITPSCE